MYEYECAQCHRRVEKIQSFSSEPLTVCAHCGGHLEKLISAPAIQFKGSGWYVNDYAKSGGGTPKSESSKSESSKSESSKSEPAKTETSTSATPAAASTPTTPSSSVKS
jgi:putative FmdB family regulatory protein